MTLLALKAAKQEIFKADQEVYKLMDNFPMVGPNKI